ncbi:MAG: tetratricopeptide repeat protein [Luteolibacter sp.]|jgi:tetratricopeptide (TPR) repeat protein|nr:tetratricopeptide repeat protein [Luteolibacter sp.]
MFRILILLTITTAALFAEAIIPPSNLFRDPKFVRDFVGSYGFLSDVEPKVSADEQAALGTIRELFDQSKFREAEAELARFIQETEKPTDPKKVPAEISPAMVFVLGNLYFQADRPDEARRAFLEAIRRFPRFRRAHTNLAYLYISKNQTDEATPMLQKAIELGENSARVYGLLGYCRLLKKNAVAAENAYRQAYLLDASSRDWKLGLAQALMTQEKFPEAANLIGTLIEENPNDKQLWLQQTNAYLAMERKDDAIVNLETLRLKGIADEANLNLLGNLHMDRNEPQLALLSYLAAMDKATVLDIPRALKSARILNDYGFPDKAEQFIARIRSKTGDKLPSAHLTALLLTEVRVSQSKNEAERTGTLLKQLVELNPADGEVLVELGRHKDLLSRDEADEEKRAALVNEARTSYQLAARIEAVAYQAHLALGQMLVRERRYPEALTHLQAALNLRKSESLEQYTSRVRRAADRVEDKKS